MPATADIFLKATHSRQIEMLQKDTRNFPKENDFPIECTLGRRGRKRKGGGKTRGLGRAPGTPGTRAGRRPQALCEGLRYPNAGHHAKASPGTSSDFRPGVVPEGLPRTRVPVASAHSHAGYSSAPVTDLHRLPFSGASGPI